MSKQLHGQAELKLKIEVEANYLKELLENTTNDTDRKAIELQLLHLRKQYKDIQPDSIIFDRVSKLSELREKHGLRITDNRKAYAAQTERAVSKLCGVAS